MLKSTIIVLSGFILSGNLQAEQTATESQPASTATTTATPAQTEATQAAETTEQAAPQQEETTVMAEEQTGFSRGSVMRSIFTNGIENREPIDNMKSTGNNTNTITYFTELRDMSGQTARHRWEHNGEVMAEVEFNVRGPRWRVWSSKSFIPKWEGEWKVSVLNAADEVISEEVITYKQPQAPQETESSPEMPDNSDPAPGLSEPLPIDSPQQ